MAKKKKEEVVEEVQVAEAPEVAVEAPKVEDLGTLGKHKVKILKVSDVEINGRQYKDLVLGDRTTARLTPEEFEAQLNK